MRKNGFDSIPVGPGHKVTGRGFYTWELDSREATSWGAELSRACGELPVTVPDPVPLPLDPTRQER